MAIIVTKHADGSFGLEGDDTPEDAVTVGMAMAAFSKNKADEKHFNKVVLKEGVKLDEAALEKCREAAKDVIRKLGGLIDPDVKQ